MNPDHLKSRKRTFGLTVEKERRKGSAGKREGKGRRRKQGWKRGTQNPLYRWKPCLPKPLQLAGGPGSPPPLRELSFTGNTQASFGGGGGPDFTAVTKLALPTLLPREKKLNLLLWR